MDAVVKRSKAARYQKKRYFFLKIESLLMNNLRPMKLEPHPMTRRRPGREGDNKVAANWWWFIAGGLLLRFFSNDCFLSLKKLSEQKQSASRNFWFGIKNLFQFLLHAKKRVFVFVSRNFHFSLFVGTKMSNIRKRRLNETRWKWIKLKLWNNNGMASEYEEPTSEWNLRFAFFSLFNFTSF